MFSMFKKDPIKKLQKLHAQKLEQAMLAQRNGDIRGYGQLTFEADKIDQEITKIKAQNNTGNN